MYKKRQMFLFTNYLIFRHIFRIYSIQKSLVPSSSLYREGVLLKTIKSAAPENNKRTRKIFDLILLFFIVSFLGWTMETLWFVLLRKPMDRGYFTMPLCTVYGSVILVVYFAVGMPRTGRFRRLFERCNSLSRPCRILTQGCTYVLYFLVVTFIASAVELVTGIVFENIFGIVLWSYKGYPYEFMKYVCLQYSILWGFLITLAMSTILPLFMRLISKLSYRTAKRISLCLVILLCCDFLFSTGYILVVGERFHFF